MFDFKIISKIFSDFLNGTSDISDFKSKARLVNLIRSDIETNQKLWNLEDSARMIELGSEHIASAKQEIDKNNQIRNDLIMKIDVEIVNQMQIVPLDSQEQFYSESPGIIIDRLAILYIKLSIIRDLLLIIKEEDLRKEYRKKEDVILEQVNRLGNFLDSYFSKLRNKEVFFEVQQPVKIYNDNRIKRYIKLLQRSKNNS
ncbi:DUF4254 domain-containing protein [Patescibacteria group bacterium]|nr:DUF4254 domain-containing protein [Patescibacteria group bacterium]